MKKFIFSLLSLVAISHFAMAQSSPFEWERGDTKIKLGGFVRFNVNSDFRGSVGGGNDFVSSNIPTSTSWDDESFLNFDPSATRLSLQITQATNSLGDIKVYVEGDFRGTDKGGKASNVRLRQAYISMMGAVAGFGWSPMSDLAANAPTIDINGVCSRTFLRTQFIGYRYDFDKVWSACAALEVPSLKTGYLPEYTALNQRVPNIPLYVQAKGSAGHIKVAGVVRFLEYGEVATKERISELGWGGQLSGSLNVTDAVKLYGQAIYGKGINTYISDLASQNINFISTDGKSMDVTPMGGASLGVSAKLSKKWMVAASGSVVENYSEKDQYLSSDFQSSTYASATLFYNVASRVTLGLEYLNGSRKNFGQGSDTAERISFMVKYTL